MDPSFKNQFSDLWNRFFPGGEMPIGFYYCSEHPHIESAKPVGKNHRCLIGDLVKVRKGKALTFSKDTVGCQGGARYLGFDQEQSPNFGHFLSYGIPGEIEGLRYKKTPELVEETQQHHPLFVAPDKTVVFKSWNDFEEKETPSVVIFFVGGDMISGLLSLASFDEGDPHCVLTPSCAGCASIVQYPFLEQQKESPKCVLGMFDISARPYVETNTMSFAIPWKKFQRMVEHMGESFLNTPSWSRFKKRCQS